MKIKVAQNRINSVLSVVVSTTDWSAHELDMIVSFGEPTVQIGGSFVRKCPECFVPPCPFDDDDSVPDRCVFTVPEAEKKIRSEFPILVEFPGYEYADPEGCAKAWSDEIVKRIFECVEKLRKTTAEIVREETYVI